MTKVWDAGCACGQMGIALRGDPERVSSCCCEACQKRTGAFVGVTVFFQEAQVVERRGEARTYRRIAESGNGLEFRFCPDCGSTVWWLAEARPGRVMVAGGAIADPELPGPERIIWTDHRHPSVQVAEDVRAHPRNPT